MLRKVSLSAMAFTYLFVGAAHYLRFDYFLSLQPDFMPLPGLMVRLSGGVGPAPAGSPARSSSFTGPWAFP